MLQIDQLEVPIPTNWENRIVHHAFAFVEKIIARHSLVGFVPVFSNALFPWIEALEAATPAIRTELDAVLLDRAKLPGFHEIMKEVSEITNDRNWQTFMFYGYGVPMKFNLARCPETAKALAKIPGVKTAFYSILAPGKRIPAHRGPYNGVLRLHLGLKVPEPVQNCWIEVNGERLYWREGEALVIDDSFRHQVHNDTKGERVVLFVDFVRPCRSWAGWLNRFLLKLSEWSPPVRDANQKLRKWHR